MREQKWGVFSIKNAVVVKVNNDAAASSYGKYVITADKNGTIVRYGHLASTAVIAGQNLACGELIGIMGDTGRGIPSPNKHLHVSVYPAGTPDPYWGKNATINPIKYILEGGEYPCNTRPTTDFGQMIGNPPYPHEGLDFSGLEKNVIDGWQTGINSYKVFDEYRKKRG